MPNVKTVTDKGDKAALIQLEDGSKPIWTPDRELARTLLGKPIPPDWTVKDGEYGPQALPPRAKGAGGMVAWRNSKEGFEAEAAGRRRWQEIEEEKKDRRTALMQAREGFGERWPAFVDEMYEWLRSSPAATLAGEATTEMRPRTPPQAGGSPSVIGEEAGEEPGEDARPKPSPGSTIYPLDPAKCSHKFPSGRWLKWDAEDRCPRCGTPKVSAVEGTTADLGAA